MRSRRVSAWLGAMITLVGVSGAPVFHPATVLAASGTVSQETPLYDSPDPDAPVIALLPEGSIVSIDGPPVDGFYPVTTDNRSGWMRGEIIQVEKDRAESEAAEGLAVDTPLDNADETAPPLEPVPADGMTPGNDPVAVDAVAPAPELASTGEVTPTSTTPDGTIPPPDPAGPVEEVAAVGPASVIVDAPILAGPGHEYGFIATAPAGSTVQQTGHVINGYATVQYAEVTGWLALAHLGAPGTLLTESPPGETAPPVEMPPADALSAEPLPSEFTPIETLPPETPTAETAPAETVPVVAPVDSP